MIVHCIRLARTADDADLTDLTDSTRTGSARWVECPEHGASNCLDMPLTPDPSADECAAIRRRLVTADAADEARLAEITAAVADPATPTSVRLLLADILARYDAPPG